MIYVKCSLVGILSAAFVSVLLILSQMLMAVYRWSKIGPVSLDLGHLMIWPAFWIVALLGFIAGVYLYLRRSTP